MTSPALIVSGDFLRFEKAVGYAQAANIRWFGHLISAMLGGFRADMSIFGADSKAESLARQFYAAAGTSPGTQAWAGICQSQCNARQLALLAGVFDCRLAITFELPSVLVSGLIALGIPFMDFTIHPARFGRSLYFGVRGNIEGLDRLLEPWRLSREYLEQEAQIALAALAHEPRVRYAQDDMAVFACQTEFDRTLIQGGRFATLEDVEAQLETMCARHPLVLVKPHPYAGGGGSIASYLVGAFSNAELTDQNIYLLMAYEEISTIYSLSSSASIEAQYFNKTGRHFLHYPLDIREDRLDARTYMAVNACFLDAGFWTGVAGLLNLDLQARDIAPGSLDLRQSLGQWWGADILYKK